MLYTILILIIFILVASLFAFTQQIRKICKQMRKERQIRISLSNRHLEELAHQINKKDAHYKRTEIQIRQEEEYLKQSISNISHDLRTPLTSMQGYLTLLKECHNEDERKQYFKIIQAKTEYLTELVEAFYDLSIVDNDSMDIEMEIVDINRVVTDCLIQKYNELKDVQSDIRTENAPIWVNGNGMACKRIVENLLVNAIRYSNGFIDVSISVDGVFTIKNSTSLSNDIDTDLLFEKFYIVDKSRTQGSSGLGLYIVKELLKKIGGEIEKVYYSDNILTISIRFMLAAAEKAGN